MSETVCHKFLETAKRHATKRAVMFSRGGRWNELDWKSYRGLVESIAAGLQTLGIRKGDRVAILSNTRLEWAATDLAILGLGAVTVPIYQNNTAEDITFVLEDSQAKLLVCETAALARKHASLIAGVKSVETIVTFESDSAPGPDESSPTDKLLSLDELQAKGAAALKLSPTLFELAVEELSAEDMATLIYTSGTTGRPKGVVLTHTQALSEVSDAFILLGVTPRDRSLSFLPYAHILGRIEIWGHALTGYTMAFARSIDKIKDDLIEIKPTLIIAVPRIFEKIYNGILAQAEISPIKLKLFNWAMNIGREIGRFKMNKQPAPIDLALQYQLARRLVLNRISERMGGRLRFAICGGAPLSQSIAEFFHAAGLLVLEGYGATETTAAITVNTPFDYRFGTVGKAIGEVKLKIAEDGEILAQSKKIMKEYYNDPAETARVFEDGWFCTGDIGEISSEGYLKITDRKKDLLKTAGGKYVAPQKLEGYLKASRYISQVHIHGDQQKYVVALLTLNMDGIKSFTEENGIEFRSPSEVIENPKVKDLIRKAVAEANTHLASFESIKNFAILPRDFTIESGELTPSLKVKRKVVEARHREQLEKLYS